MYRLLFLLLPFTVNSQVLTIKGDAPPFGITSSRPASTKSSLKWSTYGGTFQQFIDEAISTKRTAVVDQNVTLSTRVYVTGDLDFHGNGNTITVNNDTLFHLYNGTHSFSNFTVTHTSINAITFFTEQQNNILWTNHISNVTASGGKQFYDCSRGGNSTTMNWTFMKNVNIDVDFIGISVFSQDGPYKGLHLRNVTIDANTSHAIYVHPNVSLDYDLVTLTKGSHHQFSGGNPQFYNTAYFSKLNRITSCTTCWVELTNPITDTVYLSNSSINTYLTLDVDPPSLYATNTTFLNTAGTGSFVAGTLLNCNGIVYGPGAGFTLTVDGGSWSTLDMKRGGTVTFSNATFTAPIYVCEIGFNFAWQLTLNNCGTVPEVVYGGNTSAVGNIYANGTTTITTNNCPGGMIIYD